MWYNKIATANDTYFFILFLLLNRNDNFILFQLKKHLVNIGIIIIYKISAFFLSIKQLYMYIFPLRTIILICWLVLSIILKYVLSKFKYLVVLSGEVAVPCTCNPL